MRLIFIGRNAEYIAKVSPEDWEFLTQFLWTFAISHPKGGLVYARRSIRRGDYNETILMHHVVMERVGILRPSKRHTADHWNGDSLDNRRENLRYATGKEQMANRRGIRAHKIETATYDLQDIPF